MKPKNSRNAKQRYYDEFYGIGVREYRRPISLRIYGYVVRKLQRFSLKRIDVAYTLLPSAGGRFLDIGCGDGSLMLKASNKFDEVYGIDISAIAIKKATERVKNNPDAGKYNFLRCDIDEGIPFDNEFFDVVTCLATLEHVVMPPFVLEEICRVLKPSGCFILRVPNVGWLLCRLKHLFGMLPSTSDVDEYGFDWDHLHVFTVSALGRLLSKRFNIRETTCSGVFAKYRKVYISLLGGDIIIKMNKKQDLTNGNSVN